MPAPSPAVRVRPNHPHAVLAATAAVALLVSLPASAGDAPSAPAAGAAKPGTATTAASKPQQPAKPAATTAKPVATPAKTAAAAPAAPASPSKPKDLLAGTFTTTASGLKYRDLTPGDGKPLAAGSDAVVNYTGWLTDGTKFDSSFDHGRPYACHDVGNAPVIAGWNEGLVGMKPGGKRRMVVPPGLGFGAAGRPPVIPPNSTLVFDVELVEVHVPAPMPDLAAFKMTTNPSGLQWTDSVAGSGAAVTAGSTAVVQYTGWLHDSGKKFDSSRDRNEPYPVENVGHGHVIAGWNEGLVGMKVGGKRLLVVPANLGYADRGYPGLIPPGATLVFEIELVDVKPAAPSSSGQ